MSAVRVAVYRLKLPLPPSVNVQNSRAFAHPMQLVRMKNAYKRTCWESAIQQAMPKAEADLPEHVWVRSIFHVRNRRDHDKLSGSLAWALDALKCRQPAKDDLRWRIAYDTKGYFPDDDPAHLTLDTPVQVIDRTENFLFLEIARDA